MRISTYGFSQGSKWLSLAFQQWRLNKAKYLFMVISLFFIEIFVNSLLTLITQENIWLMALCSKVLLPVWSLILFYGIQRIQQQQPFQLESLLQVIKQHILTLVLLGLFLGIVCIILMFVVNELFPNNWIFNQGNQNIENLTQLMSNQHLWLKPLAFFWLMYSIVLGLVCFAPILVVYHRATIMKALIYSCMANLMNWRPWILFILLYGLVLFVVSILVPTILTALGMNLMFQITLSLILMIWICIPLMAISWLVIYHAIFSVEQ